jgi:16S rRNA G1207 methylase RsmC
MTRAQNEEIKTQLARLAYDLFNIQLSRGGEESHIPFDDLSELHKLAWKEAVWSAVLIGRDKTHTDKLTKKQMDNGYLLYAGVRQIMKTHPGIFTYSKLDDEAKAAYNTLALTIHEKIELEED